MCQKTLLYTKTKVEVNADDNIEAVAANYVKSLAPSELIANKNGSPYAFKTLLEWCIVGSMYSQNKSEKLSFNRIMVKFVVTWLLSNHYFKELDKRYLF